MNRITYGTCTHCRNTFPAGKWYDLLETEAQTYEKAPWVCPGCGDRLETREITISYKYEGDS